MKFARYHIQDMQVHAFVGMYEQEKREGNDFLINISYDAPYEKAAESDQLEDTVNYVEICDAVEKVLQTNCNLLEQVAQKIVVILQEKFPQTNDWEVTVTKLKPPVSQNVKGISITIKS